MNVKNYEKMDNIKKICEWTGKEFIVDWKHRNQRFINKQVMYEWRKGQNREIVKCLSCGKPFERYKKILHPRSGKLVQYCSNKCSVSSNEKKNKLRLWIKDHNPMNNPLSIEKIASTKLERYGDSTYNNMEKNKNTCMTKYGVPYSVYLPQCTSCGIRISKFQRRVYTEILKLEIDAKLEVYLHDIKKMVDIFIPSKNKIIECYGDYWHCNPLKCQPYYYNRLVHLTAQEIWNRDEERIQEMKNAGYDVEIVWENTNKIFKHIKE